MVEQTELKLKMEEKARKDEKMRKKRKELRQLKKRSGTGSRKRKPWHDS